MIRTDRMQLAYYKESQPVARKESPVEGRLKDLVSEIVFTHSEEGAIDEAQRCMSCGACFDCATCWSFCQDNAIIKPLVKSDPYKFKMEFCTGCKKCSEVCPCGYIEMF